MKWLRSQIIKFDIAQKFRRTLHEFKSTTKEDFKICSKCYHTYLIECIVKGKNYLNVKLPIKYKENLSTLERYLGRNGFKVYEKHIGEKKITYNISRI